MVEDFARQLQQAVLHGQVRSPILTEILFYGYGQYRTSRFILRAFQDSAPQLDEGAKYDAAWAAVLDKIPSTPTLLAVEGKQLVYAGPVTSGNLCTTAVQRVLGVTALQAPRARPILNWLDNGCYCRLAP